MKKLLLSTLLLLFIACATQAQEDWEKTLDAFFEVHFEQCYPRFRYISIEAITSIDELNDGTIIIKGDIINGGNWGPVTRKFKAVVTPIAGSRKRRILVSKQVTGMDGRLVWKACEGEI